MYINSEHCLVHAQDVVDVGHKYDVSQIPVESYV